VRIFLTLVVKDSKVLKAVNPGDSIRYEPRKKGFLNPLASKVGRRSKWSRRWN